MRVACMCDKLRCCSWAYCISACVCDSPFPWLQNLQAGYLVENVCLAELKEIILACVCVTLRDHACVCVTLRDHPSVCNAQRSS